MALEDIFRALEEQASKDSEAVLAEARAHADAIIAEAEQEAARTRDARVADAVRVTRLTSAQDLNAAKLEARKKLAAVKDVAVARVFDEAAAELDKVRGAASYEATFRRLAEEALTGVETDLVLLVDPADVGLATTFLNDKGITAEVRGDLATSGGVVVSMDGGRVMRRNTLEDRLDKLRGIAQADVAEILFT